jgi:hypothetical protein
VTLGTTPAEKQKKSRKTKNMDQSRHSYAAILDMARVRRYFVLFEREAWLDELLRGQGDAPQGH